MSVGGSLRAEPQPTTWLNPFILPEIEQLQEKYAEDKAIEPFPPLQPLLDKGVTVIEMQPQYRSLTGLPPFHLLPADLAAAAIEGLLLSKTIEKPKA